MNKRFAWVFVFALTVSGVASLLVYKLIVTRIASAKPASATLLVATHDLPVGTLIRSADLREAEWSGQLPARAVVNRKDIEERGVVASIYNGEPILEDRLAPKGAGAGMAATIPNGKRAVAVRVNEVVGLAGFVTPGMSVDVVAMGNSPSGPQSEGSRSKTILQNIEVLSAGQTIQKDTEGKPVQVQVVNLLVTPDQSEIMALASNDARIQLVLRNPLDKLEVKTKGTALARLFNESGPPPAPPPARQVKRVVAPVAPPAPAPMMVTETQKITIPIVVEVIHGGKRAETKFKNEEEGKPEKTNQD